MRYPLSYAQQHLWLLDQSLPGEPNFHLSHTSWLEGSVDPGVLQRAMDTVVARHAALRTSIRAIDGVPEQVVADTASVVIGPGRLPGGLDEAERTARAESIAAELTVRPFDLGRGPLLRAALIDAGADRSLFVLVLHHIMGDAAAMAILLTELSTVYRAELAGVPAALAPLWMDYGDYAVWQRDRLRGEELERQLGYWRERLRDAPGVLALPADRLAGQPAGFARISAAAQAPGSTQLAGGNRFAAVLAGWAVVLSRYARQNHVVIGIPVTGRIRAELEPVVGPFADVVPVPVSLAGGPTFVELLARVQDAMTPAHGELPYEKLAEELGPLIRVQCARPPAPPVLDLPGVTARGRMPFTGAPSDLSLSTPCPPDDSTLTLRYRTDLFGAPFAERLLRSVVTVLEHAARAPDTAVTDLPLPAPGELVITAQPVPAAEIDARRALLTSMSTVAETPVWEPTAGRVEPRDPVAATMAAIWGELLHTAAPVGMHDNLFALGARSLSVIRFVARIADVYGVTLPMPRVVDAPTVAELAEIVAADPDFLPTKESARDAELAALSDDELDDLLRAVQAARNSRVTGEQ